MIFSAILAFVVTAVGYYRGQVDCKRDWKRANDHLREQRVELWKEAKARDELIAEQRETIANHAEEIMRLRCHANKIVELDKRLSDVMDYLQTTLQPFR
jgi:hypothetical protein